MNLGKDVYGVIGADDSIVRERVFQHLSEITGKKYRTLYNMWLKSANESSYLHDFKPIDSAYLDNDDPDFQLDDEDDLDEPIGRDPEFRGERRFCWGCHDSFNTDEPGWGVDKYNKDYCPNCAVEMGDKIVKMFNENYDNPRDWSASEGEVEIVWDTSDYYDEFGIDIGDTETLVIDYDRVDTHDMLLEEVVRLIEDEYPGIMVSTDDFVIDNEDEFWEQRGGNPGKWDDFNESLDEDFTGEEIDQRFIDELAQLTDNNYHAEAYRKVALKCAQLCSGYNVDIFSEYAKILETI